MTTSGSTNYSQTRNEIIYDALYMINAVASEETPEADDIAVANRQLNRMIKAWEAQEIHLWTYATAILFPQYNTVEYQIYSTGAHATETWFRTALSAAESTGDSSLAVTSSADFTVGDYIGIVQDNNTLYWSTIATIPDSTTITINAVLTDDCASGNLVFGYTTRLSQPYKILSANRVVVETDIKDDRDIPLNELSYQTYFELPNKTQRGTPVSFNYTKLRDYGLISLWHVPQNIENLIRFTFMRKIDDFDTASNTADFPQEWLDCLTINLAYRLCKFFGKNVGNSYVTLKAEAEEILDEMLKSDNEMGSIFIQPDYEGGYR